MEGTIIVADDHEATRQVLADLLTVDGWKVIEVSDGRALLRVARERSVNAVVTDLCMPRMSGLTAARVLRSRERGDNPLKLVAITARRIPEKLRPELRMVFDTVLKKPVRPGALREALAGSGA